MTKAKTITSIKNYIEKLHLIDEMTYILMLEKIVKNYPESINNREILMGWIHTCSAYHEDMMLLYPEVLLNHFKDKKYAKKYIQKSMGFKSVVDILDLYPEFLGTQWFAVVAIEKFYPDEFVKKHCNKWLNSESFFNKNKKNFNFTRRMNLFSHLMTEEKYLEMVAQNYFIITDVPSHLITKEFLKKVQSQSNGEDCLKVIFRNLPYELQSDRDILKYLSQIDYNNCLASIDTKDLDKETYFIILNNIKGSDALDGLGYLLQKSCKKSWFNELVLYQTINAFSTIYNNNGITRGDDFGGAIQQKHSIHEAFDLLKESSPSMQALFNSESGLKYFNSTKGKNAYENFEKNLNHIMQDYEPCYRTIQLNNILKSKSDKKEKNIKV